MANRGADAENAIGAIAEHARTGISDAARTFRRSNRFQRWRVGVVAGWALVSLLAMWVACPGSGPSNSLGADVRVLKDSILGGQQLLVRNESSTIWTEVVLTLDGDWRHEQRTMRPHDQIVLSMSQFWRGSEAAARELKPHRLTVECQQGHASFELR